VTDLFGPSFDERILRAWLVGANAEEIARSESVSEVRIVHDLNRVLNDHARAKRHLMST
jgi:hypothetical protein